MATSTITKIKLPNGDIAELHDSRVDSMGSYMAFKGVKDTIAEIKALSSARKGDVWIARENGSEWICTETITVATSSVWEQFGTVTQSGVAYFGETTINNSHIVVTDGTKGAVQSGTLSINYDKSNDSTGLNGSDLLTDVAASNKTFTGTASTIAVVGNVSGSTESSTLEGVVSKVITTISHNTSDYITGVAGSKSSFYVNGTGTVYKTTTSIGSVVSNIETEDTIFATGSVSEKSFVGTTTRFDTATVISSDSTFVQGSLPTVESKTFATGISSATFTGDDNYVLVEDAIKSVSINNGATTNLTYANGEVSSAGTFTGTDAAIAMGAFISSLTIDTVNNALVISTANAMTSLGGSTTTYRPAGTQGKPTLSTSTQTVLIGQPTLTTTSSKFLRNTVGTSTTGYSIKPSGSLNIVLTTTSHDMITSAGTLPTFTMNSVTVLKNSTVSSGGFAYQPSGNLNIVLTTTSAKTVSSIPTIENVTVVSGISGASFTSQSITLSYAHAVSDITPTYDNPTYSPTAHTHEIDISVTSNGQYTPSGTIEFTLSKTTSAGHTHSIGTTASTATYTVSKDNV